MTRLRPRLAFGALAVVLVVTGALALLGRSGGTQTLGRQGSTLVDPNPDAPLTIDDPPPRYRIVYRVGAPGEKELLTTTDELIVRRPFDSVLRSYSGTDVTADERARTVASLGRLLLAGPSRADLVLAEPPGVSPSDVRLGPVLEDALDRGLLELREHREVLGRRCQVYRSGEPLGTGALVAATTEKHTDTCIDAAGLVLEEVFTVQGEVLFRRVAIEVDEDPAIDLADFEVEEEPIHVDEGGGSVLRMSEGSRPPTEFWALSDPPAGFQHCGRFNVVPPQPENASDPMRSDLLRSSAIDVYLDGADLVLVEQGGTLGGTHPFELGEETVDLGRLGTGDVVLSTHGTQVRALQRGGRYVLVQGTLPLDRLVDLARSLEPVEAGTIEVIEGPPTLAC